MFEVLFKILFVLAMGALAWAFPAKSKEPHTWETPMDEATMRRLNMKGNLWALVGFLAWMFGGTFLFGYLLRIPMEWWTAQQNDAPYRIAPDWVVWFITGGLFMFALARQPVEGLVRIMAGQEAIDAMNIQNELKYGIDSEAFWQWFSRIFIIAGCVMLMLMADYDVRVYDDKIVFNDWTSLFQKKTVPFDQISSITYAKKHVRGERLDEEPAYFLRFMDATDWRSVNFNIEGKESIFQLMGEKSGVGIDTVEVWR